MSRTWLAGIALTVLAGVGLYWLGTGSSTSAGLPAALPLRPGDARVVTAGRQLYGRYCASCHGVNLQGQPNWRQRRPNGRMPAPPHDASGHTWHHSEALLFKITRLGTSAVAGGNYQSDMPGFAGMMSDGEIIAVLSFIKSTWPDDIRRRHDAMEQQGRS